MPRVYPREDGHIYLKPGDYAFDKDLGHWIVRPPVTRSHSGGIPNHKVIEHEDGTITVTPSILLTGLTPEESYHGYLERGIWRSA